MTVEIPGDDDIVIGWLRMLKIAARIRFKVAMSQHQNCFSEPIQLKYDKNSYCWSILLVTRNRSYSGPYLISSIQSVSVVRLQCAQVFVVFHSHQIVSGSMSGITLTSLVTLPLLILRTYWPMEQSGQWSYNLLQSTNYASN